MIVLVVERAPVGLRGQITRWMLEIRAGVFVGTLSPRVRDKLWDLVCLRNPKGGASLVCRKDNEQGFEVRSFGDPSRAVFDNEGLFLVKRPLANAPPRAPKRAAV